MVSVSTATEVAQMFEEVLDMRADITALRQTVAILTQEKVSLQSRLTAMSRERDDELIRATEMAIILDQQSSALVTGLTKVREGERLRRSRRRDEDEDAPPQLDQGQQNAQGAGAGRFPRGPEDQPTIEERPAPPPRTIAPAPVRPVRELAANVPPGPVAYAPPDMRDHPPIERMRESVPDQVRIESMRDTFRPQDPRTDIRDPRLPTVDIVNDLDQDLRELIEIEARGQS